jgi:hypothetical protein
MAWADSADPDRHLIRICTVQLLIRNNLINQEVNSADPDQTAGMCQLIWIYTVAYATGIIWRKGLRKIYGR